MIVAGAGGHALELLDILISVGKTENLFFFDEINPRGFFQHKYPILHSEEQVKAHFEEDPYFFLGVGNPQVRNQFYQRFTHLGGKLVTVRGKGVNYSNFSKGSEADVFNLCFIGPNTKLGIGSLINTGAHVHHEVEIGAFSVINPAAVLLGACQVGDFSSIGANATILPGVKIGHQVTIGAGAVIIQNVPDGIKVVGVPGRKLV